MNRRNAYLTIIIMLVVAGLVTARSAVYTVDMTQQVILTQFGEYVRTNTKAGLDFKVPFVQKVHKFDKRILVSDANPAEYLTLDKKRLVVDNYTRWKIVDPLQFYKTVRNDLGARARLDGIVYSELRTHIAAHPFKDIIGEKRETIMNNVAEKAGNIVSKFGIKIVDVRIKRADLPKEVQQSVFERMKAERHRIAKKYRAEGEEQARILRANADKEATILLADAYKVSNELNGEGDAQAVLIYATAYKKDPEFYSFVKSLEAYKSILQQGTTLVLNSGSKLFRYLESP
jgi:membrane protease subunit HflC